MSMHNRQEEMREDVFHILAERAARPFGQYNARAASASRKSATNAERWIGSELVRNELQRNPDLRKVGRKFEENSRRLLWNSDQNSESTLQCGADYGPGSDRTERDSQIGSADRAVHSVLPEPVLYVSDIDPNVDQSACCSVRLDRRCRSQQPKTYRMHWPQRELHHSQTIVL